MVHMFCEKYGEQIIKISGDNCPPRKIKMARCFDALKTNIPSRRKKERDHHVTKKFLATSHIQGDS